MDRLKSYKEALQRLEELTPKKLGYGVYHQDSKNVALSRVAQLNCFCAVGALAPAAFVALLSVNNGYNTLGVGRLVNAQNLPQIKNGLELQAELKKWNLSVLQDLQRENDYEGIDEDPAARYTRVVEHVKKQIARLEQGGV